MVKLICWFKNFVRRKKNPRCGGIAFVEVVNGYGQLVAKLFYRIPTYKEILQYEYQYSNIFESISQLREIKKSEKTTEKVFDALMDELFYPYAKKIFEYSEGYLDKNKKYIDSKTKSEQFDFIREYFGHHLVDMVSVAYKIDTTCKKKD